MKIPVRPTLRFSVIVVATLAIIVVSFVAGATFAEADTIDCENEQVCLGANPGEDGCGSGGTSSFNCPGGTASCSSAGEFQCGGPGTCNLAEKFNCSGGATHKACSGNSCATVSGGGANTCSSDADCGQQTHRACVSDACLTVNGGGPDTCSTHAQCGATRRACINQSCGFVPQDTQPDECTQDSQCGGGGSHTECSNNSCVTVGGAGTNQCSTNLDCIGAPGQPSISGLPTCVVGDYAGQGTISWTGTTQQGWRVDIDDESGFQFFFSKAVSVLSTGTGGFTGGPGGGGALELLPAITYFVRVFNGLVSPTKSWSVPLCVHNACINNACTSVPSLTPNDPDECATNVQCAPPLCGFNASPNRVVIPPPAQSTLSWSCENTINCSIDGIGTVNSIAGTWLVSPTSSRVYALNCRSIGEGVITTSTVTTNIRVFSFIGGALKEVRSQ